MVAQFSQVIERRTYVEKLKDGKWIKRRNEIFDIAGYRCEECGTEHDLQVHHVLYLTGREPWEHPDGLLMCVCGECHVKRQEIEQKILRSVASILRDKCVEELKWQPILTFFDTP